MRAGQASQVTPHLLEQRRSKRCVHDRGQVEFAVRMVQWMGETGTAWMDVRRDVMDAYNDAPQRDLDGIAFWQGEHGGHSRGRSGRIVPQLPSTMADYCARLRADSPESEGEHPKA